MGVRGSAEYSNCIYCGNQIQISEYLRLSEESPVVMTRNGKPTAFIIHIDENLEKILLAHNPRLRGLLSEANKIIIETGELSHAEVWS